MEHIGDEERIIIIADGKVSLKTMDHDRCALGRSEVYGSIFESAKRSLGTEVVAIKPSVTFILSTYDFYNVMANHHELTQVFLKKNLLASD